MHTRARITHICALGRGLEDKGHADQGKGMSFPRKDQVCVPLWCHTHVDKSAWALRPFLPKGTGRWQSSCSCYERLFWWVVMQEDVVSAASSMSVQPTEG